MERNKVYKLIDSEREYQDQRWGKTLSDNRSGRGERSVDEFALYISGYAANLVEHCSKFGEPVGKLEIVRKIAGLCVACMEQHDTRPRLF